MTHATGGAVSLSGVEAVMPERPIALDLCSGLGGWAEGLEAEGWDVIRIDIVDMFAKLSITRPPNCLLVLADIKTFHGIQASRCRLIVASPPCTEYSWMAMPWSRAKQVARALRGEDEFPTNYRGSRTIKQLNELFDACFRIQREACEAAGRHIPMVVENVRGAQPWVGRARWNFGSYYLYGDIPALMPPAKAYKSHGMNWSDQTKRGQDFTRIAGRQAVEGIKGIPHRTSGHWTNPAEHEGVKCGGDWFNDTQPSLSRLYSSKSSARKFASAMIAKIPEPLARHIARTFHP